MGQWRKAVAWGVRTGVLRIALLLGACKHRKVLLDAPTPRKLLQGGASSDPARNSNLPAARSEIARGHAVCYG